MKVINEKGLQWWDERAREYDIKKIPFDKNKAREVEWNAILERFQISPKKYPMLAELGCGMGRFVLSFAKNGYSVTGIDVSSISLEVLKKRAKQHKLSNKIMTIHSDLSRPINELNNYFNGGYIIATYHCISNNYQEQKLVVRNFIKLIKPRGKLLILEPNPLNPLYYLFYPIVYKDNWKEGFNILNSRKGRIVNLLKDLGMEEIKVYYHSFLPTFFINYWSFVERINRFLCGLPIVNNFSAFHIITAVKK